VDEAAAQNTHNSLLKIAVSNLAMTRAFSIMLNQSDHHSLSEIAQNPNAHFNNKAKNHRYRWGEAPLMINA
jgi:hypothetical protein